MSLPQESLPSLLAAVRSLASSTLSTHIPSLSPLVTGDLVHLQGPPASGKTHFLYYLIINCLLPATLDGWHSVAVFFDTDMSFDLLRFHALFLSRLRRLLPQAEDHARQDLVRDALNRLHIFRPDSSSQLAISIYQLPKYMADKFPDHRIGLIAIDSISAFYWPDRYTAQQLQTAHEGPIKHPLSYIFDALRSVHLHCSPVTALTNWGLVPDPELTKRNPSVQMFKQHLHPFPGPFTHNYSKQDSSGLAPGKPFQVTHHITLSLAPLPRFPPGMDLREAQTEEQNTRLSLLHKGEIIGIVRYLGNADHSTFTMGIHDDDIISL